MNLALSYIYARLSEPSTWRDIIALVTATGMALSPDPFNQRHRQSRPHADWNNGVHHMKHIGVYVSRPLPHRRDKQPCLCFASLGQARLLVPTQVKSGPGTLRKALRRIAKASMALLISRQFSGKPLGLASLGAVPYPCCLRFCSSSRCRARRSTSICSSRLFTAGFARWVSWARTGTQGKSARSGMQAQEQRTSPVDGRPARMSCPQGNRARMARGTSGAVRLSVRRCSVGCRTDQGTPPARGRSPAENFVVMSQRVAESGSGRGPFAFWHSTAPPRQST
jgi:hypothetical protein